MAPPNLTALTAIDVGATPVSYTQSVHDAGVTYTVWLRHTASLSDSVIGIWAYGDSLTPYQPFVRMYTGPAAAPVLYNNFGTSSRNKPLRITVTPGTIYYFEIVTNSGNPTPANLNFSILSGPNSAHTAGDIFITDDIDGDLFPATIISRVDGSVLGHVPGFAAGEQGDILSNGYIAHTDLTTNTVRGYNNGFVFDNAIGALSSFSIIRTNRVLDVFYITDGFNGAVANNLGNITSTFILGTANPPESIASNNAGTILYWTTDNAGAAIGRWDIPGVAALSDLVAGVVGYRPSDILVLTDDSIVVGYWNDSTNDYFIRRYDSTGATLNTYSVGLIFVGVGPPRLGYAVEDANFWAFYHTALGIPHYRRYRASDGAILTDVGITEYTGGVYDAAATLTPLARFGASSSCPIIVLRTPVASTGTITINKITNPTGSSQVFDFNATGGLIPASFQLQDGQSQVYSGLAAGVYGIEEVVPLGWSVDYDVSDGSPPSAIDLAAGEVITINVTNTATPNERSGIYKIVPGKRNDTLWNDLSAETTTDVKIPNPFIKTGLIGE